MAKVVAAHGLRGALKLRCFTERAEDVAAYGPVHDREASGALALKVIGRTPRRRARQGGRHRRSQRRRGAARDLLYVPARRCRSRRPTSSTTPISRASRVVRGDGSRLGTVRGLGNFGAGDVLEIAAEGGARADACRSTAARCPRSTSPAAAWWSSRRPSWRGGSRHERTREPWAATVLTLFPAMFPGPLGHSLAGRALAGGRVVARGARSARLRARPPPQRRRSAVRRRRRHGDAAGRGGRARSMRSPPAGPARPVLYLSARGAPLDQRARRAACRGPGVVLLCGRFEGRRPAGHRGARARGGQPRRPRAVGRRARGARAARCLRPPAARGDRRAGLARRGELRRRSAGIPALHPAPGLGRPCGARGAAVRPSRADPRVAPAAGRAGPATRRPDLWARHLAAAAAGSAGERRPCADDQ